MTGIVIPDGGNIGSTSDTDALTITNTGVVKASQSIATSTIKDATGTNNSISIATNGEATFADNIIIGTAGKGIDFSNASSGGNFTADNNILDDYEHGDYDATLTCDGGTISLSAYQCTYIKIGNFINVSGYLNISAVSSPSGNIRISLPYPAVSVDRSYEGTGCCIIYAANGQTGAFRTNNGTSLAGLNTFDYQTLNANNFSGDEEISFSLTYHTA